MLSGNPMSPEAIESLMEALSSGIRQAKIANKKYTPNKYKLLVNMNLDMLLCIRNTIALI